MPSLSEDYQYIITDPESIMYNSIVQYLGGSAYQNLAMFKVVGCGVVVYLNINQIKKYGKVKKDDDIVSY